MNLEKRFLYFGVIFILVGNFFVTGQIFAALISTSVVPQSFVVGGSGNVVVNFTTSNSIPADGIISVTFPPGFTFNSGGFTTATSSNISGTLSISPFSTSTLLVRRSGGSSVSGNLSLTFSNVRNPVTSGVTGTFTIKTLTSSSTIIDSDTSVTSVTIVRKTIGALSSSSVTPGSLLANTTNNLQLSFNVLNSIPADGKIVVKFPSDFSLNSTGSSTATVISGLGGLLTAIASGTDTLILSRPSSIQHVIEISMDGLGASYLQNQINAGLAPNFKFIKDNGVYTNNARTDDDVAVTSPSHTGILTGRAMYGVGGSGNQVFGHSWSYNGWPDGSINTLAEKHGSYVPSVYDVVHDNGLRTGLYVTKDKLATTAGGGEFGVSWNGTNGESDVTGIDNGKNKIDSIYEANYDSRMVLDNFKTDMVANPFNYTLVHFSETDQVGHASGWGSTAYQSAITTEDGYVGEILSMIRNTPSLNGNTAVIITADHGGHDSTHGDTTNPLDYTIPFYVWGPSNVIASGTELYSLNTSSRLDPGTGHPNYSVAATSQPIRNADGANFALSLLGLPSIVTSTADADQSLIAVSTSTVVLLISNIKNPTSSGSTGVFEIKTEDVNGNIIDQNLSVPSVNIVGSDTTPPTISSVASTTNSTSATITWTTNENSTSTVNYGTTISYGTASTSASSVTSHSITLTGLTANTTYHFQVSLSDSSGNLATSSDYVFETGLVISSVSAGDIGNNSVNISWSANEPTNSRIEYGPNTSNSQLTAFISSNSTTSNSVSLSNLIPCVDYRYRVVSTNTGNNSATSSDVVFSTLGCTGNATVSTSTSSYVSTIGSTSTVDLITSSKEGLTLEVPPSYTSTTSGVTFQLKQLNRTQFFSEASTPTSLISVGSYIYNLKALIDATTTLSTFDKPLIVTMPYNSSNLGSVGESTLVIYRYDGDSWYPLSNCSVNTSLHRVSCNTTSFSDFGIFGQKIRRTGGGGSSSGTSVVKTVSTSSPNISLLLIELEKLLSVKNSTPTSSSSYHFINNLTVGSIGEDVLQLQKFLNSKGFAVSDTGLGSSGNETNYFGLKTQEALKKFQESKGITPISGYFGPKTRAVIENL